MCLAARACFGPGSEDHGDRRAQIGEVVGDGNGCPRARRALRASRSEQARKVSLNLDEQGHSGRIEFPDGGAFPAQVGSAGMCGMLGRFRTRLSRSALPRVQSIVRQAGDDAACVGGLCKCAATGALVGEESLVSDT